MFADAAFDSLPIFHGCSSYDGWKIPADHPSIKAHRPSMSGRISPFLRAHRLPAALFSRRLLLLFPAAHLRRNPITEFPGGMRILKRKKSSNEAPKQYKSRKVAG
jgi:hypothetical protein